MEGRHKGQIWVKVGTKERERQRDGEGMGDIETEGAVKTGERDEEIRRDGGRRENIEGWRNKCLD